MDAVQRYVSRPETVEAVRVTRKNREQVAEWARRYVLYIGEWVVMEASGLSRLMSDDEFQRRYERCSSPMPAASDD